MLKNQQENWNKEQIKNNFTLKTTLREDLLLIKIL